MKKEIIFRNSVVTVERTKTAAILQISPADTDKLAILADTINNSECITVITILPSRGKVLFTVERSTENSEIMDVVCNAISHVYDVDTTICHTGIH